MSDAIIQIRIDPKLKRHAEKVLLAMGLKISEAVRIFLQQTINDEAFPFLPSTSKNKPNKATLKSFEEIKKGKYKDSTLANFKQSLKTLNENHSTNK